MKKILPMLLLVFLLAGCQVGAKGISDADMATRVAQILTTMPTNTPGPSETPTTPPAMPTPVVLTAVASDTAAPSDTPAAKDLPTDTLTATAGATTAATSGTPQAGGGNGKTKTPTPPVTLTPGGPTATLSSTDPRVKLGKPTTSDPMESPDDWIWATGPNDFTKVTFASGAMQLTGLTKTAGWRLPLIESVPNMYIEMTARPQKCKYAGDSYGIIFRVPDLHVPDQGYLLSISCDGRYTLWKWDGNIEPSGAAKSLIPWRVNKTIVAGDNKSNRIGILINGNQYSVYVNGVLLGSATDSSYPKGAFGVFVKSATDDDHFSVYIDEMSLWHLP